MREGRAAFVVVGVFSFFLNLLMLVVPLYMMQVFDRVLSSGSTETLLLLTVMALGGLFVLGALDAVRTQVMTRVGAWVDRRVSGRLMDASIAARLNGAPIGSQGLRDLQQYRGFLNGQGIFPLFDSPWVPIFVAVIWIIHPWLGILALCAAIVLFLLALLNEVATRRVLGDAGKTQVAALRQATAAIDNAEVVQAMGMGGGLAQRFGQLNDKVLEMQRRAGDRGALIVGLSKFMRLGVQVGILGLGAYLVLEGALTAGGMIAGSILLGRALAPVEQAIGAWRGFVAARDARARLAELLHAAPPPRDGVRLPAPMGRLEIQQATFVPPGGTAPVLRQVSASVAPGQVLGVIGPSASGKSTLCRLIVGIWPPTSGSVRLDGADVHAWGREAFGRHVGYLPQSVELFAGSVADNIARMGPVNDEAVILAAERAGVHDMVLRLPGGYEAQIGEGGAVLSGGQRQRIGLARALYGNPRLIVLDEPNANLDSEGEAALMQTVAGLKADGCTVVMVAHRPSILAQADTVIMLRDGRVELSGSRDEVLRQVTARPATAAVPAQKAGGAAPPSGPPSGSPPVAADAQR